MSKSKYFGKSFSMLRLSSEGGGQVLQVNEPGSNYIPMVGRDMEEALEGLVDTLRVTQKLLEHLAQKLGLRISKPNEYHRSMEGFAHKIGESLDDVRIIADPIMSKLFQEMLARPQKPQKAKRVKKK